MKRIVLMLLLSFLCIDKGNAQAGTEFWFGFMENAGTVNNLHMVVFIATDRPVTGTISVPLSGYSQSFNIVVDSVLEIELPVATVMHVGSEIIENKGVHLVTSDSVLLYVLNTKMSTGDGTSVLPSSLLDTTYTILSYNASGTGYPGLSQFLIVATENNTTVIFEPTDTTFNGVLPFAQDTIMLNVGQSFQVQNLDGDLTGSRVKSDFPLAVFGGVRVTCIPCLPGMPGLTATDHLFEQMHPENMFGNEFTTTPLMLRDSGDTFRILAKEDSTIVQINGNSLPTLNQNEHFETILTSASIISSNRPVCVAQYSNSLGFDYTTGDPFEMLLFPASYSYKKTYFKTYYNSPVSNFDFLINIITKSSSIASVFMDGTQIPASAFDTISGSDFSYASFQVADGTHKIESDSGFIAYFYALDQVDSYGLALTGYSDKNLTSLPQPHEEQMNLKLFPNPVDEILSISLPFSPLKESLLNVKIWDVNGREVLSKNVYNSLTISVDVSELNSGIYFLVLSDDANTVIGKSKFCVNRK